MISVGAAFEQTVRRDALPDFLIAYVTGKRLRPTEEDLPPIRFGGVPSMPHMPFYQ
jgi:hypothetical protein